MSTLSNQEMAIIAGGGVFVVGFLWLLFKNWSSFKDPPKVLLGSVVAIASLVITGYLVIVLTVTFTTSEPIVAIAGVLTGLAGTLVGAILGVEGAKSGTDAATKTNEVLMQQNATLSQQIVAMSTT
jgi:hypothetical protein